MGEIPLPGIVEDAKVLELQRLLDESKAVAEYRAQSIKTLHQAGVNIKEQLERAERLLAMARVDRNEYLKKWRNLAFMNTWQRILFVFGISPNDD